MKLRSFLKEMCNEYQGNFMGWVAEDLLKNTEEKWLEELYGQEYIDYCKKVNRCIPWFPKGLTDITIKAHFHER